MQGYGIKISKKNNSVFTQLDDELNFDSIYPTFKILGKGDVSFTTNGSGNATKEIIHNFGFSPASFVWRKCTTSYAFLDASSYPSSFVPVGDSNRWANMNGLHAYTDTTKLYIQAYGASASTTYTFRYYYLVDLAGNFSGSDTIHVSTDHGIKIANNTNVLGEKEYKLVYGKKYKTLTYYEPYIFTTTLTLPLQGANYWDQSVEAGTYVDIEHNLKYPPFYLAFYKRTLDSNPTRYIEIPFYTLTNIDTFDSMASSFCDSTRVRISFWRNAQHGTLSNSLSAETATIKCYIFNENLLE